MTNAYACQNCLYQINAFLPECPQCGLRNIFISKSALPFFKGRAPLPSPLQCLSCGFQSIHPHRQCPRCTKKYASGQTLNKLVSKTRYRVFHVFSGLFCTSLGIFLGVVPFLLRMLYRQKILTEGISDYDALALMAGGLFFVILGISSWYNAVFK
jgi:hypothetical protein